jgi:hypothetical protein
VSKCPAGAIGRRRSRFGRETFGAWLSLEHIPELPRLVAATPSITLVEVQAEFERRWGLAAGLSTIHNALRRIELRHKRRP